MRTGTRSRTSSLPLLALSLALPAAVPGATSAQEQVLEEIVVTATRRAVSLQDTGATITAMTSDQMQQRSIESFVDFGHLAPGLHVADYQTETSIFIRGIGTPAIIAGNDSSTATYVDGVYYSRAAAVGPAFFDLERVEVLRGPQGTLYGRNATGGAVNLVTRKPSDRLETEVQASIGNYDSAVLLGAVGGPLGETLRGRLAARYERHDGYTDLTRPAGSDLEDESVEDREDLSLRAALEMDLGPDTVLSLTGDYYTRDDQANVFQYASAGYADEIPGWYGTREGQATLPYFAMKTPARASEARSRDLYSDVAYRTEVEIWGLTGRLETTLAGLDATFTANYKDTNPTLQNEFDLVGRLHQRLPARRGSPAVERGFSAHIRAGPAPALGSRRLLLRRAERHHQQHLRRLLGADSGAGADGPAGRRDHPAVPGGYSADPVLLRPAPERRPGNRSLGRVSGNLVRPYRPAGADRGRPLQRGAAGRAPGFRADRAGPHRRTGGAVCAQRDAVSGLGHRLPRRCHAGPVRIHRGGPCTGRPISMPSPPSSPWNTT